MCKVEACSVVWAAGNYVGALPLLLLVLAQGPGPAQQLPGLATCLLSTD